MPPSLSDSLIAGCSLLLPFFSSWSALLFPAVPLYSDIQNNLGCLGLLVNVIQWELHCLVRDVCLKGVKMSMLRRLLFLLGLQEKSLYSS